MYRKPKIDWNQFDKPKEPKLLDEYTTTNCKELCDHAVSSIAHTRDDDDETKVRRINRLGSCAEMLHKYVPSRT